MSVYTFGVVSPVQATVPKGFFEEALPRLLIGMWVTIWACLACMRLQRAPWLKCSVALSRISPQSVLKGLEVFYLEMPYSFVQGTPVKWMMEWGHGRAEEGT